MAVLINEDQFGPQAQSINKLAERLSKINWYVNAGKGDNKAEELFRAFLSNLKVTDYELKWISKKEAGDLLSKLNLEGSSLWAALKPLPDKLKKKVDEQKRENVLEKAVDRLPEFVFHYVFEKAFNTFDEEKVIKFLTSQAMYIAILVATAEIAGRADLFFPLLELLELGHVPLGPEGNVIYLL